MMKIDPIFKNNLVNRINILLQYVEKHNKIDLLKMFVEIILLE